MNIGIDKIGFYAPNLYIDLKDLALERKIDPNKFLIGLGQSEMAVCPVTQDSISMGANAASKILNKDDIDKIDLVIFATESGVDFAKSGATFIHGLLKLNKYARSIEMKHACYSATLALELARGHINRYPNKKVLIVASDIAFYGLNNSAEPTQGASAIAMIISQNPKLVTLGETHKYLTEDLMDFWKPHYSKTALVDGHFSNLKYQESFLDLYHKYLEETKLTNKDFSAICFHTPYSKIGFKSLLKVANKNTCNHLFKNYEYAATLNKRVGNIYTGSLYLNLLSLLEYGNLFEDELIGMFSYGSGAVAEFFSVKTVKNYKNYLHKNENKKMLDNRIKLTVNQYEDISNYQYVHGKMLNQKDFNDNGKFYFKGIKNDQRIYDVQK